jgi:hypothetical protein
MLTTKTESSTLTTEPISFRRLLVYCLLPASLLFLGTPLAQRMTAALHHQAAEKQTEVRDVYNGMKEAHRRAALSTIEHLEAKASSVNGTPTITMIDLNRLQSALK